MEMDFNWFDHLIFFVVCVFLPGMALMSANGPEIDIRPNLPEKKHIYFSNGLMLWIGALLVITNWNWVGRSWELLGVNWPTISTTVIIMCSLLLVIYAFDSFWNVLNYDKQHKEEEASAMLEQVLPESWKEYGQFIFLAISAGVCEEIVYRGFLVNYFLEITRSFTFGPYLAIIIPSIIFSVSHLYQGWLNVVKIFSLSILFCGIFLFSHSLLLVVAIHVFVDLASGALVTYMSSRKPRSQED